MINWQIKCLTPQRTVRKDELGQGFTVRVPSCHSRAVLAGEVTVVSVNDRVKASPSPLTVDASAVAMEMVPPVQLLLLIKTQREWDEGREEKPGDEHKQQGEEEGWDVQLPREIEGAGLCYSDGCPLE